MRGDLVFETLGGVDARFILEAAPDSTSAPIGVSSDETLAKPPKDRRPLGGWVAAAVCAVVALGVYLGAMWLGQSEWQPPAATEEGTAETDMTDPDETADETVAETIPFDNSLVEPSPAFANQLFMVEKIGSDYFLNFYGGNKVYGGMVEPCVRFKSVEDMFLSLYYGDLDENQQRELESLPVTPFGYEIMDICDLVIPVLKDGNEISEVQFYGTHYSVTYAVPSLEQLLVVNLQKQQRATGWAAQMVADREKDAAHRTETIIGGMSAVVVTKSYERNVYVSYVDEATGTEIYAEFEYMLDPINSSFQNYVSDTVPWQVNIIGSNGDWVYRVNNTLSPTTYEGAFEISKDFLLSFMIQPFDTPRVKPTTILEKQDYEIIKEDGAWYLTFPAWDGTLPDALAPAEGQSMALPVFASAQAMRETLMGDDMSLCNQIAFKMNADENGRVRIPDLDQMLVHTFPKSSVRNPHITIDPDGFYHGRVSYTTDSGHDYSSFGVISEAEWQEMRGGHIPVAGENGVLSVNVVEGTYDGLPCTFYVCTAQNEYEEYTYVFCHIHPSEATGGQEYFFTHYEFLDFYLEESNHIRTEDLESLYAIDISVFGSRNGQYYLFTLSELKDATADTLKDFSVSPLLP